MEKKKMEEIDKSINGESVKKNVNNKFKTRQNRKSKKCIYRENNIVFYQLPFYKRINYFFSSSRFFNDNKRRRKFNGRFRFYACNE